jgi:hypothetical protein
MPEAVLDGILAKCAAHRLLGNVTLLGGEPFINPARLLGIIERIWKLGAGTLEIFIPTNGRWAASNDYDNIVNKLTFLAQWFPYGLRIAFSMNEWNLEQLGPLAPVVLKRWRALEKRYPEIFYHRELKAEELLPLGRAEKNALACPKEHVGVNCSFDDWLDPGFGGFCTDYLAFYPNGDCGLCYVYHSPVIGKWTDDFAVLLNKRRKYLLDLRKNLTGEFFGVLASTACSFCKDFYPQWAEQT